MPVEYYEIEKLPDGRLKRLGGRKVTDIKKDFQKLLDKAKLPYEYISDAGTKLVTWPTGTAQRDYCWIEVGANEGYRIYIGTRYQLGRDEGYRWVHHEPISIKLLCDEDDAFKVYRFIFNHQGFW